jgi:predicted permease
MAFALVAFGVTLLAGFLYAAVLSKALPPPDNWFLLAVRNDRFASSRSVT